MVLITRDSRRSAGEDMKNATINKNNISIIFQNEEKRGKKQIIGLGNVYKVEGFNLRLTGEPLNKEEIVMKVFSIH